MERISETNAKLIAKFIDDHKGGSTILMDVSLASGWTDWFIITTVRSSAHMRGMLRMLHEYLDELGISMPRRMRQRDDTGWELLDCGDIIIHLMTEEMRSFYDLEHLWYMGKVEEFHSS